MKTFVRLIRRYRAISMHHSAQKKYTGCYCKLSEYALFWFVR